MNNKGFTLVELLATLVLLALIAGLAIGAFTFNFGRAKENTEEVFVDSLKDAVDMYLSSEFGSLKTAYECSNTMEKKYNPAIKVFKYNKGGTVITFKDVIDSAYKPLAMSEFVNPANEDVTCNVNAVIDVYRDEDYVYYYSIDKNSLVCLKNIGDIDGNGTIDYSNVITNLPEGYSCK